METLEKIFGSRSKVRIMRLFLFNPEQPLDIESVSKRSKTPTYQARKEINNLKKIGLIKARSFLKESVDSRKGVKKKRVSGWILEEKFPFLTPLILFEFKIREREINSEKLSPLKVMFFEFLIMKNPLFIRNKSYILEY